MLYRLCVAFAAATLLAAGQSAALAQTGESPTTPAAGNTVVIEPGQQQPAAESRDDIVCRIVPPTTGTRLGGGRECHKRREWDQREHDAQLIVQKKQTLGYVWNPKGAGH